MMGSRPSKQHHDPLSDQQRVKLVALRVNHGLSFKVLAERFSISVGGAQEIVRKAKEKQGLVRKRA